ncbi:hypothetical protein [Chryseobacterium gambrini]|uniref:hypothetical protein n=1 Tax=Chryseobacterium gambrini TaxID=373672 RepID=UPI0022F3962D|nr:hypothetical protein [Chryseobacterium gambrini]WBX99833.1 hypothetical protein PE065_11395 [Chryseobacterium gambrini]
MKNTGLVFILLFPFYCFPQFTIPKGFSEFTESPANGKEMKRIVADFDKDNKDDVMTVIYQSKYKEDSAIKKYLIIYLSSKKKTFFIDFDLFNGVYVVPLKYKNDVLDFLIYQDGTCVYGHGLKLRFNQKVKEIQLIGYDYSYRTTTGHCNKTYNLLTGDYIVTNDYYNWEKDKTEFENFKGNKKRSKSIFIKDFTFKLFEKLSLIGKEYERE